VRFLFIGLAVLLYTWIATFRFRIALVLYIGFIATAVHGVAVLPGWSIIKMAFPPLVLGFFVTHLRARVSACIDRDLLLWVAALLAAAFVGIVTSEHRTPPIATVWQLGGPMVLGLIVAGGSRSERTLRAVAWGIVGFATVSALIALAQASHSSVLAPIAQLTSATEKLDPRRVPGPFDNPNGLAAVLSIAIPIGAALFAGVSVRLRIALAFMLVAMSAAVVLSYSRAGWVGLAAGLPLLLAPRRVRFRLAVPIALLFATSVALYFGLGAETSFVSVRLGELALDTFSGVNSFAERLALWHKAIMIAQQDPILGIGFGNFPSAQIAGQFRWVGGLTTHNVFLTVLAEMGLVGLALFVALIVKTFRNLVAGARAYGAPGLSLLSWGFLASMVSYVVGQGMAHGSLVSELMWVLIGLSFAVRALATDARASAVAPAVEVAPAGEA
jgi:O-antigen ligase